MTTKNSIEHFQYLKAATEAIWAQMDNEAEAFCGIAKGTKWLPGLSEEQLQAFETAIGFPFPEPLRNFYRVMNGFDRPYTATWENLNGETLTAKLYRANSYPRELEKIRERIKCIYDDCHITPQKAQSLGISRIFPLWWYTYMMIDEPGHPTLSMTGNDITFDTLSLAEGFSRTFLGVNPPSGYHIPTVRFWFPKLFGSYPKKVKHRRKRGLLARQLRQLKKHNYLLHRAMG